MHADIVIGWILHVAHCCDRRGPGLSMANCATVRIGFEERLLRLPVIMFSPGPRLNQLTYHVFGRTGLVRIYQKQSVHLLIRIKPDVTVDDLNGMGLVVCGRFRLGRRGSNNDPGEYSDVTVSRHMWDCREEPLKSLLNQLARASMASVSNWG